MACTSASDALAKGMSIRGCVVRDIQKKRVLLQIFSPFEAHYMKSYRIFAPDLRKDAGVVDRAALEMR